MSANEGGPWGGGGSGGPGDGGGPRNPWGQPPRKRRPSPSGNITSLDEFLKKSRSRFGGRFPRGDGRPYWLYGILIFIALWIVFTSVHRIGPEQRGVVTQFGDFIGIKEPGISFTLPAPIQSVEKVDVEEIRTEQIPAQQGTENLILTGDQNIIDLAYSVRWNISEPQLYLYQLADPEETIREVAESAMRAVVARVSLDDAIGAGRSDIEQRVETLMQQLLNDYGAGVRIQGVAIEQSDPPEAVNDAFKEVSAAQQQAQTYLNDARAYALQLTAKAQGEAAAFDKVYEEYRLAPDVTRRRMYYETMERVLGKVDKTIVDAPGVVPYLPLPEANKQNRPSRQGAGQ